MNIVFLSSEFPINRNAATGGIGTYLVNLTEELTDKGHRIIVITRKKENKHKYKKIKVITVDCDVGLSKKIQYPFIFSLKAAKILFKIQNKEKIDVIEGNDFGGELFFYLLLHHFKKIPVIIRLHTPYFVIHKFNKEKVNLFLKVIGFMEKFSIKMATAVYSPTKNLAKIISNDTGVKVGAIIPYPFPVNKMSTNAVNIQNLLILYVGKLQIKKGVFVLLDALKNLKKTFSKIQCHFVGPDTLYNQQSVKKLMQAKIGLYSLKDNVSISDNLMTKTQLSKMYKKATVIIVPSFWENFPNVVLEAFSYRLPVIANKTGGIPEMIVDGYNGMLYKANNEKALAYSIKKILKNRKLALKLSDNARKTLIERYNSEKIVVKTLRFYTKTIKKFRNEKSRQS